MRALQITCIISISLLLYACPTQESQTTPQPQDDKAQQLAKALEGNWLRESTYNSNFDTSVAGESVRATCSEKNKWVIRWAGANSIGVQVTNTHNCANYVNNSLSCPIGSNAPCTHNPIKGKTPNNPVLQGLADAGTFKIDEQGRLSGLFYLRFAYTHYTGSKSYDEITVSNAQLQLLGNNTLNVVDRQASKVLIQLKRE